MKKAAFVFTLLVATAASAANVKIMFSTPGPDTYADGTEVLKGERYALVWKAKAADTVSFLADGSVTGGKVLFYHKTTEAGRCSKVLFQASEKELSDHGYVGGVWSVHLLDTRVFGADEDGKGIVSLAEVKDGAPALVNGVGVMDAPVQVAKGDEAVPSQTGARQLAVSGKTELPAGVAETRPVITNVEIDGAFVRVTVANTLPFLNYGLESGESLGSLAADPAAPQAGVATADETITLVSPKVEGGARFFKVNRK